MNALKAHVRNGRLVMDEPVDLPEGTEVGLAIVDAPDDLDDEERARLHAALAAGLEEVRAGKVVDAAEVLERLRAR